MIDGKNLNSKPRDTVPLTSTKMDDLRGSSLIYSRRTIAKCFWLYPSVSWDTPFKRYLEKRSEGYRLGGGKVYLDPFLQSGADCIPQTKDPGQLRAHSSSKLVILPNRIDCGYFYTHCFVYTAPRVLYCVREDWTQDCWEFGLGRLMVLLLG